MICLDPHVTQDSVNVGTKSCPDEEEADSTYHTELFYRWHMDQLDPSIALVSITKIKTFSRCLKITEKVSFNIASEASYVYILSGQKFIKNAKNGQFWRVSENLKLAVK